MSVLLVGYARVSTQDQDLTAQRDALAALCVPVERTYVDHGLTGTNRDRPGLREALAACRSGDTLVVTKLDRLARSLPDARDILEDLTAREVKLSIGGSVHDPTDPVGRLLFNVLAMVAEFESDLIRLRTREGMRVGKAKGHLRGRPPKLNPRPEAHLVMLHGTGEHSTAELSDLFGVGRSTVLPSHRTRPRAPKAPERLTSGKRDPISGTFSGDRAACGACRGGGSVANGSRPARVIRHTDSCSVAAALRAAVMARRVRYPHSTRHYRPGPQEGPSAERRAHPTAERLAERRRGSGCFTGLVICRALAFGVACVG